MNEYPTVCHDDMVSTPCPKWYAAAQEGNWVLTHSDDDKTIDLTHSKLGQLGDWVSDETPNCPFCGANLLVDFEEDFIDPWDWFGNEWKHKDGE